LFVSVITIICKTKDIESDMWVLFKVYYIKENIEFHEIIIYD